MEEGFLYFDPKLVEEAVFTALKNCAEAGQLHTERVPLYETPNAEEREQQFGALYRAWFQRLKLAEAIEQALQEQPTLISWARSCIVLRSAGKRQEGAELLVSADAQALPRDRRPIRLLLCPESLLDGRTLLTFLRHELLHIVDMLDPAFGYEPSLPHMGGGPAHDTLLQERYRTLWDCTIDGRMVRWGWSLASVRSRHFSDFALAFPMLGKEVERFFAPFFDEELHTHSEFVSFAQDPGAIPSNGVEDHPFGSRCPLCAFPTHKFEPAPEDFSKEVLADIWADFPEWRPVKGLCVQCADLYRARHISETAAMAMPGATRAASRNRTMLRG